MSAERIRRLLEIHGRPVTFKRPTNATATAFTTVTVKAAVHGLIEGGTVGPVGLGGRRITVAAKTLEAAGFPGAPKGGDKAVIDGKTYTIDADSVRSVGWTDGRVVSYVLAVRG